jgi:hypothetical protein
VCAYERNVLVKLILGIMFCAALIACAGGTSTAPTAVSNERIRRNIATPPPVGWQFLNPDPITTPLCTSDPCTPNLDANSSAEVAEIYNACGPTSCPTSAPLNIGEVQEAKADKSSSGEADTDPLYFATSTDPEVTVECPPSLPPSKCYIPTPVSIRIPIGAAGSADSDHHATVFYNNVEYDLWQFTTKITASTTIAYAQGGEVCDVGSYADKGKCQGTANAAGIAQQAGQLDPREWIDGSIDHAIYVSVICPQPPPHYSWPADSTDGHCAAGPQEGERIWLDMTDSHINLLASLGVIATWEATLLHAWHDYGFVVVDSAGCGAPWNFYGVDNQTFTIVGDTTDGWPAFWTYLKGEGVTNFYWADGASHLPIPNPHPGETAPISQSNIHIAYQPGYTLGSQFLRPRTHHADRMRDRPNACSGSTCYYCP